MIIQPGSKAEQKQDVKQPKEADKQDTEVKVDDEFASMLKGLLTPDSANQINEEEFFAALVKERVQAAKGEEAAGKYSEALTKFLTDLRRDDGYVSYEDSAKAALKEMVASGDLTTEEGEKIFAESFKGAQLDDNLDALYDGRGGPGDATIAVADMEKALLLAKGMIEKFDSGEEDAGSMSLDTPSNTKSGGTSGALGGSAGAAAAGGLAGFLFKPESEKSGDLVILAPEALTGQIESVFLKSATGEEIEEGEFSSVANGGREHFRFSKPGGEYPKDLVVEILLKDGTTQTINITDPSERVEM